MKNIYKTGLIVAGVIILLLAAFIWSDMQIGTSAVLAASTQRKCDFVTSPDQVTWGYCNDGYQFRVADEFKSQIEDPSN